MNKDLKTITKVIIKFRRFNIDAMLLFNMWYIDTFFFSVSPMMLSVAVSPVS